MNETVSDRDTYIDQLKTLHALRDDLELSSKGYQDILQRITGSVSARYMTEHQRDQCITYFQVYKSLNLAIERAMEARESLLPLHHDSEVMTKEIYLDGKFEAKMKSSIEEVIKTMRCLHGDCKLVGMSEINANLRLEFSTPSITFLAS